MWIFQYAKKVNLKLGWSYNLKSTFSRLFTTYLYPTVLPLLYIHLNWLSWRICRRSFVLIRSLLRSFVATAPFMILMTRLVIRPSAIASYSLCTSKTRGISSEFVWKLKGSHQLDYPYSELLSSHWLYLSSGSVWGLKGFYIKNRLLSDFTVKTCFKLVFHPNSVCWVNCKMVH